MKKIAPILLAGLTTLALVTGCSSDTEEISAPTSTGTAGVTQSPDETETSPDAGTPTETDAAVGDDRQQVVNTIADYQDSLRGYSSSDFTAFMSPDYEYNADEIAQLLEPTAKYFHTADLTTEELEQTHAVLAMSAVFYAAAVESSGDAEKLETITDEEIESLRNDPEYVTVNVAEDGMSATASGATLPEMKLVKVDGVWLIDAKAIIEEIMKTMEGQMGDVGSMPGMTPDTEDPAPAEG